MITHFLPSSTDEDPIDALVADILATLRTRTVNPAEGFGVLELVFYMLWSEVTSDGDLQGMLGEFVANVMILHKTNDIQGTA